MASDVLAGRIALVTGASRGIGRAVALELARAGAHVIALARTQGGLEELDDEIRAAGGSPATLVPVNITDYPALDRLGASIFERWGKLDILIGNAGVLGKITPVSHADPSLWDEVMAVNVTANWRLIRSLDPLLRASDAGRAVFITSGAAQKCMPYWGPYSVSKAALDALVKTYAAETASVSPLKVNLLSPGPVATKMRKAAMPGEDQTTLPRPEAIAAALMPLVMSSPADSGKIFNYTPAGLKVQA